MISFRKLIFLYIVILTSSGCYRICEDFNYDIIQWMPYEDHEQVILSNSGSNFVLSVTFREITHTEKMPRMAMCICENSYTIGLASDILNINVNFFDSGNLTNTFIEINRNDFVDFVQQWDELVINGREYTELIEFSNQDRPEHETYYRIIIARNYGIVSIQVDDDEWFLVDDTDREIEPTGIKKNITQC